MQNLSVHAKSYHQWCLKWAHTLNNGNTHFFSPAGADSDSGTHKSLSSYRGNSKVQQMKVCEDMVNDLMREEAAWPFLKPVSKKLVRLPFYTGKISGDDTSLDLFNSINRFF